MISYGVIEEVNFEEFEGTMLLRLNNITLRVCYNAPEMYARKLLLPRKKLLVDLWLLYGSCRKIEENIRCFLPVDNQVYGGKIQGRVKNFRTI